MEQRGYKGYQAASPADECGEQSAEGLRFLKLSALS